MTKPAPRPLLIGLVALALATTGHTQSNQPTTAAARQLTRWIETFNSGDRTARLAFLSENFPSRAGSIDQDLAFRERTGGFDLIRFTETSETKAVALIKERDNESSAVKATIEVEAAAPNRIVNLGLQPGIPLDVPIARLTESELASAVRAEAEKRAAAGRFSGAVMVARNGTPVVSGAWGLADRERGTKNQLETRFRNGSMNKMFTATAIMTLVQSGKVALDAPLGRYLTDYPNQSVASKVTIHHLLTHTGGTGDIFGPEFATHRLELKTHADYLALYGKRDLRFEPGARFEYSNYGFVLLGAVIERVSGQSYYDYVRDHVFVPAGMTRTGAEPEDQPVADRSVGYLKGPGGSGPNTETLPYRGTAAGGGYTTVGDLVRFATALMNHTLLDARHTDLLLRGKVDAMGAKYAYGFIDRMNNGVRTVGHGGGAPGMNGDLIIFPESGYAVAALANIDPPAAERISSFAANRVPKANPIP